MKYPGKYVVLDSKGQYLKSFETYKQAHTFRIISGRYDFQIITKTKTK